MNRVFLPVMIFFAFTQINARAQRTLSVEQIENTSLEFLKRLENWSLKSYDTSQYDSMAYINKKLLDYLEMSVKNNPATLTASFKRLKEKRFNIVTSDDRKVRIYCWDILGTGTARSFNVLLQYKKTNGIGVQIINDDSQAEEDAACTGAYYRQLSAVKTRTGDFVYLPISNIVVWSGAGVQQIDAFKIERDTIKWNIQIFKTGNRTLSSISCEYDLSKDVNKMSREIPHIELSADKKKIAYPDN
jgi:hypothetical protein